MRVLIVDDQTSARRVLSAIVSKLDDVTIVEADGLAAARAALDAQPLDVALIDLRLGPDARNRDGLVLVEEIRARTSVVPIIVTAYQEVAEIRMAMRVGAYDYILKDDLCDELVLPVLTGLRSRRRLERELRELRARRQDAEPMTGRLVGVSPAMEVLRETIRRAALSDRPVLVIGPTGSGKELVVEALHTLGPHPDHPLLDLNCGAIPESLMESQLFGHAKGAFTGADREQQGYLTLVKQGTLFLDEVAELPVMLQAKLLRVLETGVFRPVGSPTQNRFEGRVVAATHAELADRVRGGTFREDLFYRLNVLSVRVPPLAERREDIPALVAHFCRGQKRPLRFSEAALDMLAGAAWPGHVRQLRNLVDRVAAFADDDLVTPEALAPFMTESPASNTNADVLQSAAQRILRLSIENKLEAIEEALVAEAVRLSDGNKSGAARLLGMHRKAVSRRL
ncbi:MAG TPA: sigma-54 dependent transcriptional regulator [Polyangia bacterium]|nr:sigma-54 dependent transcriptional regulator [Polyangia bacterium]